MEKKVRQLKKVTDKQKAVFQLYADGFNLPTIAKELNKSESAVYAIVNYFKSKYGFPTITNVCCELIRKEIIY